MLATLELVAIAPAHWPRRAPPICRATGTAVPDELTASTVSNASARARISQARYSPAVERYMQPPIAFGQRNWLDYRARYLDEPRIQAGATFVRNHQLAMGRAQREFGVPAEIIAAIIGVETHYGRITGNFRTSMRWSPFVAYLRAPYYRKQLTEFFLLVREQTTIHGDQGSFAGALGFRSHARLDRRHAVDFDGDGA